MQILNRKAHFNYEITEEIEAGMILLGSEVKSLREGKASITEAYIVEKKNELILINSNISEYKGANRFNHLPKRDRKLLLHKKQLSKIIGKLDTQGFSAVPIKIFFNKTISKYSFFTTLLIFIYKKSTFIRWATITICLFLIIYSIWIF
jgi:SsrA-binding protein